MSDLLAPGGLLSAHLPHYEDRPEQRAMAAAVATALADDRALLVEAGTGTGKTLAYLIPAILSGKRVVVSTGTRTLQEQLWRHDIPLLRDLLGRPVRAAMLKGVSNYLCQRRLAETIAAGAGAAMPADLEAAVAWARDSVTGDRAELGELADDAAIWSRLTVTPETRLGARCPHNERCFVTRARREADEADLIIVNHHLFFADLALRTAFPGARVLPEYEAVIFDEAHQLEDVLTDHFGRAVSTVRLGQLARDARIAFGLAATPLCGPSTARMIEHLEGRAALFFAAVAVVFTAPAGGAREVGARPASAGHAGRVPIDPALFATGAVHDSWLRLDSALEDLIAFARAEISDTDDDDRTEALASLCRRGAAVRDDLAALAEPSADDHVHWGERRGTGVFLHASPIEVGDLVRRNVLETIGACVFTSATLTSSGDFAYVRRRLGLDPELVDELELSSPFDYERQALLYLPADLPEPRESTFDDALGARVRELLAITSGRAFVLFTSHRGLQAAARRLRSGLGYPLLIQGEQPRATLVERFRAAPGSVLLGTGSFWEGVDVPGDALSLVIMDKLPFAPPSDPLVAARMRRLEDAGLDPFAAYQVPQAALALKQGFGRLIRRRDDRGIVALLDGRVRSRAYGRVFLDSLPAGLRRTGALEQVRRFWSEP